MSNIQVNLSKRYDFDYKGKEWFVIVTPDDVDKLAKEKVASLIKSIDEAKPNKIEQVFERKRG